MPYGLVPTPVVAVSMTVKLSMVPTPVVSVSMTVKLSMVPTPVVSVLMTVKLCMHGTNTNCFRIDDSQTVYGTYTSCFCIDDGQTVGHSPSVEWNLWPCSSSHTSSSYLPRTLTACPFHPYTHLWNMFFHHNNIIGFLRKIVVKLGIHGIN